MRIQSPSIVLGSALALAACQGGGQTMEKPAEPPAVQAPAAPAAPVEEPVGAPGAIKVTVAFEGTAPKAMPLDRKADPYCAKTKMNDESVMVNKNNTLQNVVVKIDGNVKGAFTTPTEPVQIHQEKCMYRPRVTTAVVGQKFAISNGDTTLHNVHAYKGETEQNWFNSAQPPNSPAIDKEATEDGMVRLKCDVHPWMSAWVSVSNHPFVGVTGAEGAVNLENVPSRTKAYKIKTWHEKFGPKEADVMVEPGKTAEVTITYSAADQKG